MDEAINQNSRGFKLISPMMRRADIEHNYMIQMTMMVDGSPI